MLLRGSAPPPETPRSRPDGSVPGDCGETEGRGLGSCWVHWGFCFPKLTSLSHPVLLILLTKLSEDM